MCSKRSFEREMHLRQMGILTCVHTQERVESVESVGARDTETH